jgi:hypothetical protein
MRLPPRDERRLRPLRYERNDQRGGYDFLENELLEWSLTPVPANSEALIAAAAGVRRGGASWRGDDVVLELADDEVLDIDPATHQAALVDGSLCGARRRTGGSQTDGRIARSVRAIDRHRGRVDSDVDFAPAPQRGTASSALLVTEETGHGVSQSA